MDPELGPPWKVDPGNSLYSESSCHQQIKVHERESLLLFLLKAAWQWLKPPTVSLGGISQPCLHLLNNPSASLYLSLLSKSSFLLGSKFQRGPTFLTLMGLESTLRASPAWPPSFPEIPCSRITLLFHRKQEGMGV